MDANSGRVLAGTNATSFAVVRSEHIRHAFASDQHFATAGFTRIPVDLPVAQM